MVQSFCITKEIKHMFLYARIEEENIIRHISTDAVQSELAASGFCIPHYAYKACRNRSDRSQFACNADLFGCGVGVHFGHECRSRDAGCKGTASWQRSSEKAGKHCVRSLSGSLSLHSYPGFCNAKRDSKSFDR